MKKLIPLLALTAFFNTSAVLARTNADELQALREQILNLTSRLDELEKAQQQATQSHAQAQATTTAAEEEVIEVKVDRAVTEQIDERMAAVSWAERMRWKGDFRYRYESIDVEDKDRRGRNRIRARVHLEADVSDTVQVGFGLATGGEDPVSSNQTLGRGGSSKDLRIDLAYFDWDGLKDSHVYGGKFSNFVHRPGKNQLLWDSDWRPEGTGIGWNNGMFFANGLGTWIESDTNKGQSFAYLTQLGISIPVGESMKLTAGVGYHNFETAGSGSFFGEDDDFFGIGLLKLFQT